MTCSPNSGSIRTVIRVPYLKFGKGFGSISIVTHFERIEEFQVYKQEFTGSDTSLPTIFTLNVLVTKVDVT